MSNHPASESGGLHLITTRAAALADEIWWQERFLIGATPFNGQIKPDPAAARCITRAILDGSGFAALYDALMALRDDTAEWWDLNRSIRDQIEAALAKAEGK